MDGLANHEANKYQERKFIFRGFPSGVPEFAKRRKEEKRKLNKTSFECFQNAPSAGR